MDITSDHTGEQNSKIRHMAAELGELETFKVSVCALVLSRELKSSIHKIACSSLPSRILFICASASIRVEVDCMEDLRHFKGTFLRDVWG